MSILEKYSNAFMNKDEAAMNEVLHDDYKFTMHASGNVFDGILFLLLGSISNASLNDLAKAL